MIDKVISSLNIPKACLANKRINKKDLEAKLSTENKKILRDRVEKITLHAFLQASNSNIVAFKNEDEDYSVLTFIIIELKQVAGVNKIADLMHNTLPNASVLLFSCDNELMIHFATKRISQIDADARVLDTQFSSPWLNCDGNASLFTSFANALDFSNLNKTNLKSLYFDYISKLINYNIALQTGSFVEKGSDDPLRQQEQYALLLEVQKEMEELKGKRAKEKQMNIKIAINDRIFELKDSITELMAVL